VSPAVIVILAVAAVVAGTVVLIVRGILSAQRASDEVQRLRETRKSAGPVAGLRIRPLAASDKAAWQKLWYEYCDFYDEAVPQPVTDVTWQRLHDPQSTIQGYGAYDTEGTLLGIAHIVLHPHTWSVKTVCYLEDLFVSPAVRGRDVGHSLIDFLWKKAAAEGWRRVYWHTAASNAAARRLYDRFKPADSVVRYTIDID